MDRIAPLERENGRLQERVETVTRERDEAIAAHSANADQESDVESGTTNHPIVEVHKPRSLLQKLLRVR